MKKAKEYFKEECLPMTSQEEYELWCRTYDMFPYIERAIRKAQEDAIRETVKECAKSAKMWLTGVNGGFEVIRRKTPYFSSDGTHIEIDSLSILNVADKLIKEL